MTDIVEARELYEGMARYFEESGFAPNQAQAYREMLDVMSDCATAEEAADKLKSSPYCNAGAVALMRDKALARARAARELGMDDVALTYEGKEREIAANGQAMFDNSFEREAQKLRTKHADERAQLEAERKAGLERACSPDMAAAQAEASSAWEAVRAHKNEIVSIGARMLPTIRCAECIVISPDDETGAYSYANMTEEVR